MDEDRLPVARAPHPQNRRVLRRRHRLARNGEVGSQRIGDQHGVRRQDDRFAGAGVDAQMAHPVFGGHHFQEEIQPVTYPFHVDVEQVGGGVGAGRGHIAGEHVAVGCQFALPDDSGDVLIYHFIHSVCCHTWITYLNVSDVSQ